MFFEPLESRTFLSVDPTVSLRAISATSSLIQRTSPRDLVFDPTRNQLLVAEPGTIERFDASTGQLIGAFPINAYAIDITPDGELLYAVDGSYLLHRIELATGRDILFQVGDSTSDTFFSDVAISDNTLTISQPIYNNHPFDHLRSFDLLTHVTSDVLLNGAPFTPDEYLILARSADYKHTFMVSNNYDYEAGGAGLDSRGYGRISDLAVSRDGALHAIGTPNKLLVLNSNFDIVAHGDNFSSPGLAFDPARDVLYASDPLSNNIYAFDTHTWATLFKLPIGEDLPAANPQGAGKMTLSSDGNSLFLLTNSGVRVFQTNVTYASPLLFVAEVSSPGAPDPTGTVTFVDSTTDTVLGQAPIQSPTAQLTLSTLHGGNYSIIANYSGDDFYNPATSAPFSLTVARAATIAAVNTTTGAAVVTLTSPINIVPDAGQVDLFEGNTQLDSADIHNGSAQLTLPTSGIHTLRLVYNGSDDYLPTSLSFDFHAKSDTTLTLAAPASITWGQSTPITATLSAAGGAINATGYVDFRENGSFLGTASVAGGQATLSVNFTPGQHPITAQYLGDQDFRPSGAAAIQVIAGAAKTTLALSASNTYIPKSTKLTLTATVTGENNGDIEGTVSLFDGTRSLGLAKVVAGVATANLSFAAGQHSITARYNGDSLFKPSDSNRVKINVINPITIDLLALYTPAALRTTGSNISMRNHITDSVTETNVAFMNSHIPVVIRVVRIQQIKYTESGKFNTDLDRLQGRHDGYMDSAHSLRNTYGADLVSLFESDGDLGGIAFELRDLKDSSNPDYGFSVIRSPQADAPTFSFAHEIGHNLGATHDIEHRDGKGATPYSNGFRFRGNDGVLYHDIMSYDPGTTIQYFSNPTLRYQGVAIGSSTANAARTISLAAPYVAKYRRSRT